MSLQLKQAPQRWGYFLSGAPWVSLPGCDVLLPRPSSKTLQLSVAGSGWFLTSENEQRQILCGHVDALATTLLKAPQKRYFGFMVSSVLPGLCIGPALNLAVESILAHQLRGNDANTVVRNGERIAIVSRSHALRDYLAESTLQIGRETFPFMMIPTFRLNRRGEEQPARFGRVDARRAAQQFRDSPKFLFYDLSPLGSMENVPPCAIVLGEIAEADGAHYIERLLKFAWASHARYVVPIISYHDIEKRRILQGSDFTLVTLTKADGIGEPEFTFSSLSAATPPSSTFRVVSCATPIEVAVAIDRAYRMLRHMWRICGNAQPRQLRRAWNLLDDMTSSPSAIDTLEVVRRNAPGVTTIGFALSKLAYLDSNGLPPNVQTALTLRWPHLCEALSDIYAALRKENPISEKVMERILDAKEPLTVMTRNDFSAVALQRELLFEWEWKDDGRVRIGSAAKLARERVHARNLLAVGFNPASRPQLHWSALPETFTVVTFPHMLTALAEYQESVRRNASVLLPKSNEALGAMRDASTIKVTRAPAFRIVIDDLHPQIIEFARVRRVELQPKEQADDLIAEEEMALAEMTATESAREKGPLSPSALDDDDGTASAYVIIRLVGGEEHRADIKATFAVLPADDEGIVKLKATELSQGDRIVLLGASEHRSVYALIAERTQHLFPIDERALDLWEAATDKLRQAFSPESARMVELFCTRLEAEGCVRGRQTMRHWLNGRVHAPEALSDLAILLRVAGMPGKINDVAQLVFTELEQYRNFRRTIGRAIVRRHAQRAERKPVRTRVDEEIDEVLELCDIGIVDSIDVIDSQFS